MKDQLNSSQHKLVSLEEGYLDANDRKSNLKLCGKNGASKCTKRLVLLIPILVFLLGWYSYTAWQAYRTEQIERKKNEDRLPMSADVQKDQLLSYKIPETFNDEAVLIENIMMKYLLRNAEKRIVPKVIESSPDLSDNVEVVQREPVQIPALSPESSVIREETEKSISKVLEDTSTITASIVESDDTVEEQDEEPNSFASEETRDWADLAFFETSKISSTEMSSYIDDSEEYNSDWTSEKSNENPPIDNVHAEEAGESTTTKLPTKLESTNWSRENEENEGHLKDAKMIGELDSIIRKDEFLQPIMTNRYLCTVKPWALSYYVEYHVIIRMCEYQSSTSVNIETLKEGTKNDVRENDETQDHAWKDVIREKKIGLDDDRDSLKRDEFTQDSILDEVPSSDICDDEGDTREPEDLDSSMATAPVESGQKSEMLSVDRCPEKYVPEIISVEGVTEELPEADMADSIQVKRYLFQFIMPDLGTAELNVLIEEQNGAKSDQVELVDEDVRKESQNEDVDSVTTLKSSFDSDEGDKVDDDFEYHRYNKFMHSESFLMPKDDSSVENKDDETAILGLESEFDKESNDGEDMTVESSSIENEELRDMMYGDDYDDILTDLEDSVYDPEFTYENIRKRSIEQKPWNSGGQLNLVSTEIEPAQRLRDAVHLGKDLLVRKMMADDGQLIQRLNLKEFFNKMDILSAHIDRLHERYLRMNQLNDDYISKEFSMETVETS